MNRKQLQLLADERVRDAEALLASAQWSGAYYLAGYSVECALKACIAKLTNQDDFPNKDFARQCHTHNIEDLVRAAGMKSNRVSDAIANPALGANWLVVRDWTEQSRYEQWTESQARQLFTAITDKATGVLPWIKGRW